MAAVWTFFYLGLVFGHFNPDGRYVKNLALVVFICGDVIDSTVAMLTAFNLMDDDIVWFFNRFQTVSLVTQYC